MPVPRIRVTYKRLAVVVLTLAVLNGLLLVSTSWAIYYYRALPALDPAWEPLVLHVLSQFNLTTENVLAAWYSSMLLLLVSCTAVLCFFAGRERSVSRRDHALNGGWIVLAAIFALLSFDELGVVHERLGNVTQLNPLGDYPIGWVSLLAVPIGLVGLFMLWFSLVHVRRSPWAAALIVLGILLFLTIPFQERIEVRLLTATGLGSAERPILGALLEEGAEIFGSLAFFAGMAIYGTSSARRIIEAPSSFRSIGVATGRLPVLFLLALVATGMVLAMATSPMRRPYSPDALSVASYFSAAVGGYDADLAAAFAAEDVILRIVPPPVGESGVYRGKEQLRGWIEQARAEDFRFRPEALVATGNTIQWRGAAMQDSWRRDGTMAITTSREIVVEGGKVQSYTLDFAPPLSEPVVVAENWFPSALAALAALLSLHLWEINRRAGRYSPYLPLAIFNLFISAYVGANLVGYANWGSLDLLRQVFEEAVGAIAVVLGILVAMQAEQSWRRMAAVAWALLLGAGLTMDTLYSAPLAFVAFVALFPPLLAQVHRGTASLPEGEVQADHSSPRQLGAISL